MPGVCEEVRWVWRHENDGSTVIEHDELVAVLESLVGEQLSSKRKTRDKKRAGGGHLVDGRRCGPTGGFGALIQKKLGARQVPVAKAIPAAG